MSSRKLFIDGVDEITKQFILVFKESLCNKINAFIERDLFSYSNIVLWNEIVNEYLI